MTNEKLERTEDAATLFNIENPLKPYYKEFHSEAAFKEQGRPLTEETYKKLFNKHVCIRNFLHEEKAPFLKKMNDDARFIYDALEPIRKLGINYTIDLTGGCVRDFILNKHTEIKDLDFMISLPQNYYFLEITKEQMMEKTGFSEEAFNSVDWQNSDDPASKKVKLIKMCMDRTQTVEKMYFYPHSERIETVRTYDEDVNSYEPPTTKENTLMAVIKLTGEKTNYPIDLLLTDYIKPVFMDGFDFDICKASFCIVNTVYKKSFPKNYSHLLSRFSSEIEFWADVANNKMTYNLGNRSERQIERSFGNHLKRLQTKYSEYSPMIVGESDFKEFAEGQLAYGKLNSKLADKDESSTKRKKI